MQRFHLRGWCTQGRCIVAMQPPRDGEEPRKDGAELPIAFLQGARVKGADGDCLQRRVLRLGLFWASRYPQSYSS